MPDYKHLPVTHLRNGDYVLLPNGLNQVRCVTSPESGDCERSAVFGLRPYCNVSVSVTWVDDSTSHFELTESVFVAVVSIGDYDG